MIDQLHRVLPGYAHDDTFLDLAAGLHVVIERLDAVLARHAPPGAASDAPAAADPVVTALLGLIAIRDRLVAALDAATASPAAPSPAEAAPLGSGSLLR